MRFSLTGLFLFVICQLLNAQASTIHLLSPTGTDGKVGAREITFEWENTDENPVFLVKVYKKGQLIHEEEANGNEVTVDVKIFRAVTGIEYQWEVIQKNAPGIRSDMVKFVLVSPKMVEDVKTLIYRTAAFQRADQKERIRIESLALENAGLYYHSDELLKKAIAENEDDDYYQTLYQESLNRR